MVGAGGPAAAAGAIQKVMDIATGKVDPVKGLQELAAGAVMSVGVAAMVESLGGIDQIRSDMADMARRLRE